MSETENDNPPDGSGGNGSQSPRPPSSEHAAVESAPIETIEGKLARLEKEKAEAHDRMLRLAADFENYKRRSRREMEESQNRGRESLLKEMLPVLDNLDRALQAVSAGGTVQSLGDGVRLVDKQLHLVLEKFDVKRFEALGEPFDPARHEAIQQVEAATVAPGAVAQVFARGYTIGERLLRPAMVAVAKGRPASVVVDEDADGADDSGGDADGSDGGN